MEMSRILKKIVILTLMLIVTSCSMLHKQQTVPDYTSNDEVKKELVTSEPFSSPTDTTGKTIIVYNVVEREDTKKGLTDETWRALIAQFFSTVSTIFALEINKDNNTP